MDLLDRMVRTRFLFLALASVGLALLVANLEGQKTSILVGNLMYVPVTFFMAASAYFLLQKQRRIDDRDRGWLLFFGATVSWLLAEHTWMVTELVFHGKTFPSAADFFYIGGYLLMGTFIFKMLWPLRTFISTNTKLLATLVAAIFLVPTAFAAYGGGGEDLLSLSLSLAYPVMDAVLLWPGIIVLITSSKLRAGNFWTAISIGIISLLVGDTIFSYESAVGTYYTGYPFEFFFYAAYVMFGFAALVRSRQALAHSPLLEEISETFREHREKSLIVTWKVLLMLSVSVVITFLVLVLEKDIVQHLSSRELEVIAPFGYALSGLVFASIMVILFLVKKIRSLRLKVKELQYFPEKEIGVVDRNKILAGTLQRIEKLEMRRQMMIPFWAALIVALVVVSTYIVTSTVMEVGQGNALLQSGPYLVENLKGSNIDTWVTWNVYPRHALHVTIVNSNLVDGSKIQAIEDAILSNETVTMANTPSAQNSSGSSVYYKGWTGALYTLSQQNASMAIPTGFEITRSDKAVGDIVIILSTDLSGDGSLGFTKSIADTDHHQLLKSFITIFNAKGLSSKEIGDVTRHEFGHALGLGHSSDPEDLMNEKFHADRAYISQCDLAALASLYSGDGPRTVACTHA